MDLVNWTQTLARWAIRKPAVDYQVQNLTFPLDTLFRTMAKSHLHCQFKLYMSRHMQYHFPFHWCLGEAFPKVESGLLVFTM